MAVKQAPRSSFATKQRLDYRIGYRRLLLGQLIWPMLAVFMIGVVGSLLIPQSSLGAWFILIVLILLGGFISVPFAIIIGGVVFISATPFLFYMQSDESLSGALFILFALLPFSPILLSAARARQLETTRLSMLLNLPQVRAAIDLSEWSLLPKPRSIDQRLKDLEKDGINASAIILRVSFPRMSASIALLGIIQLQQSILLLADDLRFLLRVGDMIAEDVRGQGVLYIVAFHNPDTPDSLGAILRRLSPGLKRTGLEVSLSYGYYPDNGRRLHAMEWQMVNLP